jgi:hypothetical protein
VRGLAIYGVGSAAVEALANAACQQFEQEAVQRSWQASVPFSPGMVSWSVEEGQRQIFSLLDSSLIDVTLTNASFMLPMKSLSMVMGFGPNLSHQGKPCDFCVMREVCKYHPQAAPSGS